MDHVAGVGKMTHIRVWARLRSSIVGAIRTVKNKLLTRYFKKRRFSVHGT
jgi:hypothetical protein